MIPGGPLSIAANGTATAANPSAAGRAAYAGVRVTNLSGLLLAVSMGAAGNFFLAPYCATMYSLAPAFYQGGSITFTAVSGSTDGVITLEWFTDVELDEITGGHPGASFGVGTPVSQVSLAPGSTVGINGTVSTQSALPSNIFGNGSDGAVTLSANVTLIGIKQYTNLTVNNGITVTSGYPIFVNGTLTSPGTCTLANNGGAGGFNNTPGLPSAAGTYQASGAGGASTGTGSTWTAVAGGNVTAPSNAVLFGTGGGQGGSNGTASYQVGGAGGSVPAVGQAPQIIYTLTFSPLGPGAGGGQGGAAGTSSGQVADTGCGGAGGGVIVVVAATITGTVNLSAVGGKGGDASNGGGWAAGGGGGGGGGVAVLLTNNSTSWTGTTSIGGGAPGANASAPTPPSGGGTGIFIKPAVIIG